MNGPDSGLLVAVEGTPPMASAENGVDLVARVASARVALALTDSQGGQVLMMIAGMDPATICAVARRINRDHPAAEVEVHNSLADDAMPPELVGARAIADFRNSPQAAGCSALVFAPSVRELDDVGKTAGDIPQISEHVLVAMPDLWLECSPELRDIADRERGHLRNALTGLVRSSILVGGVRMFGEFVYRLDAACASMPLERALDEALPALRIPKGAGKFKKVGAKGRLASVQTWEERFRELHEVAHDALHLRRNGEPLSRPVLRRRLAELADENSVDEDEQAALDSLITDNEIRPGQWTNSQQRAANLRWVVVERLIKPSKKKSQVPLGQATLELFATRMPTALSDEDHDILEAMGPDLEQADDEERDFFFRRRTDIADYNKPLLKRWEAYVFRKTGQHADLALGLFMAIADLVEGGGQQVGRPQVLVRLDGADKQKFWDTHNRELCRYLRDRYRGLDKFFGQAGVRLDFGMCWSHPWDAQAGGTRTSRLGRDFKFDILLLDATPDASGKPPTPREIEQNPRGTTQLVWSVGADTVASSYSESMIEVANSTGARARLASGRFSRAQDQERSTDGRVSFQRRATFQDATGQPNGLLVDPNDGTADQASAFSKGLEKLEGTIIPDADAALIRTAFKRFELAYTAAVRAMVDGEGLAAVPLLEQAERFGELLELLRTKARKDECRLKLWKPILSVGVALADGSAPLAICTPWHPFKLAGAAAKAHRLTTALRAVLSGEASADIRTFARTVEQSISHGWYPAVSLFFADQGTSLVCETDQFADFGLMEPPTRDQGAEDAFDGFSEEAARELLAVADEYLDLQPHDRASFSVVLYNADNRSLPANLATELAAKVERENDFRCDLILTHADQRRLRQIYTEQNVTISAKLDGALASEAAQNFLSRLRVGFIDLGGFDSTDQSVQASDIVFLHDVIARAARTSWRKVQDPRDGWPAFVQCIPDRETRRRHFEIGTRKTESLLVPAERPLEVQHFLNLVRDFHLDSNDDPEGHYVPVREVSFDEGGVGSIIEQAHGIGRWVVTYDAIADGQLFRSNGVKIIRYVPRPDRDHNLVVSTRSASTMLLSRLSEEVGTVLGIGVSEADKTARICVDAASSVSGRVVLRAARLENNALELLGLVLSKRIVSSSLAPGVVPVCWLLLDDFAERLGHHRGQKADLVALCLSDPDAVPTVEMIVIESKFVSLESETQAMRDSIAQLRASTNDLRDRIVRSADALNRPTWLGRLADLLLEQGVFHGTTAGRSAQDWARAIRTGEAHLRVSGASMVFTHDRLNGVADPLQVEETEQRQYTFNRDQVASVLREIQAADEGTV